jgi:hypothetical protein
MRFARMLLFLVVVSASTCLAQTSTPLEITTKSLPDGIIERPYSTMLQSAAGTAPLTWKIISGKLSAGLKLNEVTGLIDGTPHEAGVFTFKVALTDSTGANVTREFTITVQSHLVVDWQQPAALSENTIAGSIKIENYSGDVFDLTVIVVAVNQIGKAFALGYERMNLAPSAQQVVSFSSSVPNGNYVVHADAIAEIPARNQIYRKHMQTENAFTVNVNR